MCKRVSHNGPVVIPHPLDFHLVSNPSQLPQLVLIEQSQARRLHMVALDAINFCLQQLVALLQRAHLGQAHSHSQAGLQSGKAKGEDGEACLRSVLPSRCIQPGGH